MSSLNHTLVFRIPGTGPGTGPVLGSPVPSLGVDDWTARFDGSRLTGAAGATYTTWPGIGSAVPTLATTIGGATATVASASGDKYLHTTKSAGAAMQLIGSGVGTSGDFTLAALIRVPNKNSGDVVLCGGVGIGRALDGRWQAGGLAAGSVMFGDDWSDGLGWTFVAMSVSGSTVTARSTNAGRPSGTVASGTVTRGTELRLMLQHPSDTGDVDFALVAAWNRALSSGELATVDAAFLAASNLL